MFNLFKKKNIYQDLEKIQNEISEMKVDEIMSLMMRISNIESIDLGDLKTHTFILVVLTLKKMGYKINEHDLDIDKNRELTIAIDDCVWRIRDDIMNRLSMEEDSRQEEMEKAIFDAFHTNGSYQTTIDWNDALMYAKKLRPDFNINNGFDVVIDDKTVNVRFIPNQKEGTAIIIAATYEQIRQEVEAMEKGTFKFDDEDEIPF